MNEIQKRLNRANKLQEEINTLDYFNSHIIGSKYNTWRSGGVFIAVNCVLKKKIATEISILGSRFYGCGTHKKELTIPNSILDSLAILSVDYQARLQNELNDILKDK